MPAWTVAEFLLLSDACDLDAVLGGRLDAAVSALGLVPESTAEAAAWAACLDTAFLVVPCAMDGVRLGLTLS